MAHAHAASWQRREPEGTVLHRVVQSEWATALARFDAGERHVPRFCVREVEAFLRCGILVHGFAQVWCEACRHDGVVAFSCKGRGFCPSCGTRRMVDTAAFLVDEVIPDAAPVRRWVLSLPYRVRLVCAHDPATLAAVRRILVRAGGRGARAGCVTVCGANRGRWGSGRRPATAPMRTRHPMRATASSCCSQDRREVGVPVFAERLPSAQEVDEYPGLREVVRSSKAVENAAAAGPADQLPDGHQGVVALV
ncbi:MAG TPA: transposase zinc-binding domain-containing protein [Planctomycetota bacterium]|nr:transposase zinc-binding domain-containing protein [Planctomycetota bacterium]